MFYTTEQHTRLLELHLEVSTIRFYTVEVWAKSSSLHLTSKPWVQEKLGTKKEDSADRGPLGDF